MAFLSPCATTEDLGSGRHRAVIHVKPIAYRDGGSLYSIARDWADSGITERPHIVTAAPFIVSHADDGMRRIHPTRELDRYFEIGAPFIQIAGDWTQVQLGTPERSGNLLTWTRENANLYSWMGGHFIKIGILLKNGWVPENGRFAFRVGLNGLTRSGGLILADGEPVMRLRRPMVYDWDNRDDIRPIDHQFVQIDDQWYSLLTLPDLSGMSRPLVDPTFDTQPDAAAGKDTWLKQTDSDANYGVDVQAMLYEYGGAARAMLIEFDCSGIAGDATCDDATLYVYAVGSPSGSGTVTVHSIASGNAAWPEGTKNGTTGGTGDCCWDYLDQDATPTSWAGSAGLSTSGTDYEASALGSFSVLGTEGANDEWSTTLTAARVEGWFGDPNTNYGIRLSYNDNSYVYLHTSDGASADYRPNLVVNYTEAAAGGALPMAINHYRRRRVQ